MVFCHRPGKQVRQQQPVVGGAWLGAEDCEPDAPPRGVVAADLLGEAVPDHTVPDHDDVKCFHRQFPRSSRTAQTLNSGIPLSGSSAGLVSALAAPSPGKWKGKKTVSVRSAGTKRTFARTLPRRERILARVPSARPACRAVSG